MTITLGDTAYVMDANTIVRLGSSSHGAAGGPVVELALPYPARLDSRWAPYACAPPDITAHLFPSAGVPPVPRPAPPISPPSVQPLIPPPPRQRELIGHLAELEVMRRLGEPTTLNTFKSFPDLEEAEYLVRHRPSGNIRGVQVKCLIARNADARAGVDFHGPSFVASPITDAVILAWREDLGGFDDCAWLIPTIDLPNLLSTAGYTLHLSLRVSASIPSRFDRYRVHRGQLATMIEVRVGTQSGPGLLNPSQLGQGQP